MYKYVCVCVWCDDCFVCDTDLYYYHRYHHHYHHYKGINCCGSVVYETDGTTVKYAAGKCSVV